jgi:endonuclease YncB( thermonuclease family)
MRLTEPDGEGEWRAGGFDAPESHQTCEANQQTYRCGQQAALALANEISGSRRSVAKSTMSTATAAWSPSAAPAAGT